jgi:hypothetical protein
MPPHTYVNSCLIAITEKIDAGQPLDHQHPLILFVLILWLWYRIARIGGVYFLIYFDNRPLYPFWQLILQVRLQRLWLSLSWFTLYCFNVLKCYSGCGHMCRAKNLDARYNRKIYLFCKQMDLPRNFF